MTLLLATTVGTDQHTGRVKQPLCGKHYLARTHARVVAAFDTGQQLFQPIRRRDGIVVERGQIRRMTDPVTLVDCRAKPKVTSIFYCAVYQPWRVALSGDSAPAVVDQDELVLAAGLSLQRAKALDERRAAGQGRNDDGNPGLRQTYILA